MMEALVGARLHTPEGLVPGRALLLADGTIRDIVADDAVPATARTRGSRAARSPPGSSTSKSTAAAA